MQQFSARRLLPHARVCAFVVAAAFISAGCRKEEINTFSVPKDTSAVATASAPASGPRQIGWTTPAGWEEQPAGGMRVGSFLVKKDGQQADASIIPLGRMSGTELNNVNRWRDQVGLAAITESDLASAAENVRIGDASARLYDIAGSDPKTQQPTRILAAILSGENTTWFFKMVGPDALVASEKAAFKDLLKSVRFESGTSGSLQPVNPHEPLPEGHPPLPDGHPPVSK